MTELGSRATTKAIIVIQIIYTCSGDRAELADLIKRKAEISVGFQY